MELPLDSGGPQKASSINKAGQARRGAARSLLHGECVSQEDYPRSIRVRQRQRLALEVFPARPARRRSKALFVQGFDWKPLSHVAGVHRGAKVPWRPCLSQVSRGEEVRSPLPGGLSHASASR